MGVHCSSLYVLLLSLVITPSRAIQDTTHDPDIILGEFIVRFTENGNERDDRKIFDHFYTNLNANNINPQSKLNISSTVFTATSLKFLGPVDLMTIRGFRNVENIWPVRAHFVPQSIGNVEVPTAYSLEKRGASFKQSRVEDLHKEGIMGEGVVVAVLDTGIDYMHPALGGGIGPGYKVRVARDFSGTKEINDNGMDFNGHGTHIAGVIAGMDPKMGFVGVAPMVTLHSYRLSREVKDLALNEDAIIAAAVRAYEDKVDVISISIDSRSGWGNSALAVAFEDIAQKGVFIAAAAGNSGMDGPFNAGSVASGTHVTAVGSVTSGDYFTWEAEVSVGRKKQRIPINSRNGRMTAVPETELVILPSTMNENGACMPIRPNIRLDNVVVLVKRGPCGFQAQLDDLVLQGAANILIYNDDEPYFVPMLDNVLGSTSVQYTMTTAEVGRRIVSELATAPIRIEIFNKAYSGAPSPNELEGGRMMVQSSWGPTNDFKIKPEISAPGGQIFSTYPISLGSYATLSGTSMAAPFIAGVAALYIGVQKKFGLPYDVMKLRDRIMTSGNPIPWYDGYTTDQSLNAPVAQVGGGYIDAWKVVKYKTSVSPGKIELGPTQSINFLARHEVTIFNHGESSIWYHMAHTPDPGFLSLQDNHQMQQYPLVVSEQIQAELRFEPDKILIGPKDSGRIIVHFKPSTAGDDDRFFPVFSGRVQVIGSNKETLSIPYLGAVGDPRRLTVLRPKNIFINVKRNRPSLSGSEKDVFTMTGDDHLAVDVNFVWGSPEIKVEIVRPEWSDSQWRYHPDFRAGDYVGRIPTPTKWYPRTVNRRFRLDIEGLVITSNDPAVNVGTKIWNGDYKVVLSVLKPLGERENRDHWDVAISPVFTVSVPEDDQSEAGRPLPQR